VGHRASGPVLLNSHGTRMDRHAATRRLRRLAEAAGVRINRGCIRICSGIRHDHARRGVDLRDVQIAARHADPRATMRYDRARKNLDRHPNYILAAHFSRFTPPVPGADTERALREWGIDDDAGSGSGSGSAMTNPPV
jgi:integrase/recombinase XerD